MNKLFELTPPQQKAFDNLKKALNECLKQKLFFYNNYGTLGVTDSAKINQYDDTVTKLADQYNAYNPNELRLPCHEWADDPHYFHPTQPSRLKKPSA